MSYSVKIVDNDNSKVIVDCKDALGIIGAIGSDEGAMGVCSTHCNAKTLFSMMKASEEVLSQLREDRPELKYLDDLFGLMEKFNAECEKRNMENE